MMFVFQGSIFEGNKTKGLVDLLHHQPRGSWMGQVKRVSKMRQPSTFTSLAHVLYRWDRSLVAKTTVFGLP